MSEPTRASNVVEENTTQAFIAIAIGVVVGGIGLWLILYPTVLTLAGWVMAAIGLALFGFAAVRFIQCKQVPVEKVVCPSCQFSNALTGPPTRDFTCQRCLRSVPIENGAVLPVYRVNCEHCGTQNFFSRRALKLICEECGKDINLDSIRSMLQ